jgi:eukaryotic-like serine/threonine-protein kinase
MVDPRHDSLRRLFDELFELDGRERSARLAAVRAADAPLADEVERLLSHASQAEGFLSTPPRDPLLQVAAPGGAELLGGRRVAGYRLVRMLASGGMGTVFEAEQGEPRRRVALKTLRFGAASQDAVRRFRIEAEVLGRLKHPSIAQIHEAGVAEIDGALLPYLAMELVEDARSIVRYAKEEDLGRDARLELFEAVCAAVHHGHQKGVLHRDLKAENALVDSAGRVKVIDFGLARALDPSSLGVSLAETRAGDVLGTLSTMSPEHLSGDPDAFDARSDVYSLGCILFELLCGRPPVDVSGLGLSAAVQRLQTEEPVPPAELPRDLRRILAQALARDPDRRYGSAADLAQDLARFRRHETVLAGEPSALYRLAKFSRRHRLLLSAAGAVIVALSLGLGRAQVEARAARDARDDAGRKAALARGVSTFLMELFVSLDAYAAGSDAKVKDQLERGERELAAVEDPAVHAVLEGLVGQGLLNLGELERAEQHLAHASAEAREHFAPDAEERIHIETVWADCLEQRSRLIESRDLTLEVLPRAERSLGANHRDTRYLRANLASCYMKLNEYARAEELHRQALSSVSGPNEELMHRHRLAVALRSQERYEEADPEFERAAELAAELGQDLYAATIRMDRATELMAQQRKEDAVREYEAVEKVYAELHATSSNRFALAMNLALVLLRLERPEEALPRLELAAKLLPEIEPEPGSRLLALLNARGLYAAAHADYAACAEHARSGRELAERLYGPGNSYVSGYARNLSNALRGQGDVASAEDVLRDAVEEVTKAQGESSSASLDALTSLVLFLKDEERFEEALPLAESLVAHTDSEAGLYAGRLAVLEELRKLTAP